MKRIFLLMLVAIVAAVSCQKSQLTSQNGSETEVEITITAKLDNAGSATRAIGDFGTGSSANRCILEVYTSKGDLYTRLYEEVENFGADFSLRLVTNQTYQFVAWADHVADVQEIESDNYYVTADGLKQITVDELHHSANSDVTDAFFANQEVSFEVADNYELTLTRPTGQLNVLTKMTDVDPELSLLNPKGVKVEYSTYLPASFDASQGIESGELERVFTTKTIETVIDDNGLIHLSTDYILAPASEQLLVDFVMTFYSDEACTDEITYNDKFVNIPIQRNYRTNVTGELLSQDCYITVEVVPGFENPDIVVGVVTVESVSDLNDYLESYTGEDDVVLDLTTAPAEGEEIIIPETLSASSVEINLCDVSSDEPIVITAENDAYAGNVTVNNNSENEMDLTVTAPNSHVTVSGSYSNLVVSSSSTTCVIVEGSEVRERLTVESGNVDVYGTVGEVVRSEGNTDKQTIVRVYSGGTVGSYGEGITMEYISDEPEQVSEYYLADFVEGFVPEGTTWEILDETATNENFAGLRAQLTEGVNIALDFPNLKTIPNEAFYGCQATFSFSSEATESIEDGYYGSDNLYHGAFSGCANLTAISLSNATYIGVNAFYETRLSEVSLLNVTEVGGFAFYKCEDLTSVSLPEATTIGEWAFSSNGSLASVSLPEATKIGNFAFNYCTSLSDVSLLNVTEIGNYAFRDCSQLASISLPEVTKIGDQAFSYTKLSEVSLLNVIEVGAGAFSNNGSLTSVSLPNATEIGAGAFIGCTTLSEVSLPEATEIGDETFSGCSLLNSISMPKATKIGGSTFMSCSSLTSIHLPSVTEVSGWGTFFYCTSLTSVSLPAVTTLNGDSTFAGCDVLANLELATNDNCVITTLVSGLFWSNPSNITLSIGAANSDNISGNTLTVTSYEYGTQSYTFKEITLANVGNSTTVDASGENGNIGYW